MCYSAQIQAAYMKYLRETGAEMDVDQFVEIFGARVSDFSIRIPRAVERWFDEPKTDGERKIKTFIEQYRDAEITKLEREAFIQKKRLADAERTLASKTTKAATESKRIATNKIEQALTRLERLKATKPHVAEARIFPMHYAPIVLQAGDRRVMRLGRYHCRKPGERESVDRQLPGLYNARRDSLGKYWQGLFGVSHAVMMVESFFENVDRDGKNVVLDVENGTGQANCLQCFGTGKRNCFNCNSTGRTPNNLQCFQCNGTGRQNCSFCQYGKVQCPQCFGSGQR
jgi:hypothetical protein